MNMRERRASFWGMVCLVAGLTVSGAHLEGGQPTRSGGKAAGKSKKAASRNSGQDGGGANWLQAGGNQAAMAGWPGAAVGVPQGAPGSADTNAASATAVTPASAATVAASHKPALGPADATGLNGAVLKFAEGEIGQRVGSGLCWELGVAALAAAGAQPPQGNSYGTAVTQADAKPGDIIVFNTAYFRGANYWMLLGDPLHVAVLESISGAQIVMLHQNFNGQLFVTRSTLNLGDLKRGTVTFYQPVAR
jgi:hypothetical protein